MKIVSEKGKTEMAAGRGKWIVCVLAVLLLSFSGLLAGCSREQAEEQAPVLDWYINFSWFSASWGEDHVTQAITQATGTKVHFLAPAGGEADTLNAMMEQNALPDLITVGWWSPQVSALIEGGYVYPLNELAERYAPAFFEVAGSAQLEWYRQEDGNIYGYPSFSVEPNDQEEYEAPSNVVFVVRKDLYEALGCPDMSTPEGFANTLRRAVEEFPLVDGQSLIPLGVEEFNEYGNASLSDCLRDFLAIPQEKDGQAYDYVTDPDYLEWLETLRQLVADGTITSNLFLDKRQQVSEKLLRGQYFCLIYQWSDMEGELRQVYQQTPERMYLAIDGPKNRAGADHTLSAVGMNGWTLTFISRTCAEPERAIALMTYLLGQEGKNLVRFGVEGVDYQWQGDTPELIGQAAELFQSDYTAYTRQIGANNIYWMLQDGQSALTVPALDQIKEWSSQFTVNVSEFETAFEPGSEEAAIDEQTKLLWGETLPALLLAPTHEEFQQRLESYLLHRQELGWDRLQQAKTERFQENKAKLAELFG